MAARRSYALYFFAVFAAGLLLSSKRLNFGLVRIPGFSEFSNALIRLIDGYSGEILLTPFELSEYDGLKKSELYIAVLGKVYDVSSAPRYYGPGQSYHGFVGRDASKAFITGDFSPDGLNDDLSSLPPNELRGLLHWIELYENNYVYKGKLIGRFYDERGNPTSHLKNALKEIDKVQEFEMTMKELDRKYPPCNLESSMENGRVVWCSNRSGGIQRDWVGYPRKFIPSGTDHYRCACIQFLKIPDNEDGKFETYYQCPADSVRCKVIDDDD